MKLSEEAKAAVRLLTEAGLEPVVTVGNHFKVKVPGLPIIVCAKSSSDRRGLVNTITRTKRMIRSLNTRKESTWTTSQS